MASQNGKLRQVDWHELLPWMILVRSVRVALMARVLILGALGLIAMTLGWRAIGYVFSASEDPVIQQCHAWASPWIWEDAPEFDVAIAANNADELFSSAATGLLEAPVSLWLHLTRPFIDMFRSELTPIGFLYLLLCGIWELLVWGLAGGAITRIAALQLTRNEAPDLLAATAHATAKLPSYSLAPLIALAGAAVFAIQLVILGWVMRLSFLAMIAAIVWPFVLMLGLLMAILLIGALVGWPLMWATVSVEGTDAFDALSRGYAYTYQRPWRLLWYVLFAGLLAAISMFAVKLFAASAIALGDWSISWGLDDETMYTVVDVADEPANELAPPAVITTSANVDISVDVPPVDEVVADDESAAAADAGGDGEPAEPGWLLSIASRAILFWKSLLSALAAGYQAGFLWVAAVAIYLLLRHDIDGAEMDEVYLDQQEDFGMPTLSEDAATGVPEVPPSDIAQPGDTGETT